MNYINYKLYEFQNTDIFIIHSEINYITLIFQWQALIPTFILYKEILTKFNYKQELLQPFQAFCYVNTKIYRR